MRFVVVGFSNTGVDIGLYNLLIWIFGVTIGWPIAVFSVISTGMAMINSYFLNKYWSFKKKKTEEE